MDDSKNHRQQHHPYLFEVDGSPRREISKEDVRLCVKALTALANYGPLNEQDLYVDLDVKFVRVRRTIEILEAYDLIETAERYKGQRSGKRHQRWTVTPHGRELMESVIAPNRPRRGLASL